MANGKMQVVFASAEASPFVKTGGLGDVAGSLPAALSRAGADVIVMVPKYGTIAAEYLDAMEHLVDFYVPLGWRNEYCGLERLDLDGVTYLFIDNERYFKRDSPYGFFDDGERFAFFSKAVTESLQHLPEGFTCDILHCNDWHTALAPVFLREFYQGLPRYEHVKSVFSIHNIAFQGQFSDRVLNDILGLAHIPAAAGQLRCDATSVNYMQGALHYADAITTVSPTYAEEIRSPEFGENLDPVLRERSNVLSGILNGIDVDLFDPASDRRIPATFDAEHMDGKRACKAALQRELGLEIREDRPLMVMVSRLTRQKGLDLVTYSLERILSGGVQVAVLGTGDRTYEDALNFFASLYPGVMATRIQFNPALSHRMYAGADMLLMPSLFEPCGLSQMISMRYGALPIVRETGGLKDTVTPYNRFTGEGTGFSFTHFNGDEMGDIVFLAARLFWDDREAWRGLVARAMRKDFSWVHSAGTYLKLYEKLQPERVAPGCKGGPEAEVVHADAPRRPGLSKPDVVRAIPVKHSKVRPKRATIASQTPSDAPDRTAAIENVQLPTDGVATETNSALRKAVKKRKVRPKKAGHPSAATKRPSRQREIPKTSSHGQKHSAETDTSAVPSVAGSAESPKSAVSRAASKSRITAAGEQRPSAKRAAAPRAADHQATAASAPHAIAATPPAKNGKTSSEPHPSRPTDAKKAAGRATSEHASSR